MRVVGIILIAITVLAVIYAIVMLSKNGTKNGTKDDTNGGRTENGDSGSRINQVSYLGAWGTKPSNGYTCSCAWKYNANGTKYCPSFCDLGTV
jgi:hypothetical protein